MSLVPTHIYVVKPPAKSEDEVEKIESAIDSLKKSVHFDKLDVEYVEIEYGADFEEQMLEYGVPELWIHHNKFMMYPIYAVFKFEDGMQKVVLLTTDAKPKYGGLVDTSNYIQ